MNGILSYERSRQASERFESTKTELDTKINSLFDVLLNPPMPRLSTALSDPRTPVVSSIPQLAIQGPSTAGLLHRHALNSRVELPLPVPFMPNNTPRLPSFPLEPPGYRWLNGDVLANWGLPHGNNGRPHYVWPVSPMLSPDFKRETPRASSRRPSITALQERSNAIANRLAPLYVATRLSPPATRRATSVAGPSPPVQRVTTMQAAGGHFTAPPVRRRRSKAQMQADQQAALAAAGPDSAATVARRRRQPVFTAFTDAFRAAPVTLASGTAWLTTPQETGLPPRARFTNDTAFALLTEPGLSSGLCSVHNVLYIGNEPLFELLTPDEVVLCSYMRIRPQIYLTVRAAMFANYHRVCVFDADGKTLNKAQWSKSKAQQVKMIDVNKLSFLHKFYGTLGLWDQRWN